MTNQIPEEIKDENRRIRFLRLLVDLSLRTIQQDDLTLDQAFQVVKNAKVAACNLFPGKEKTFELIYRPRFLRTIREKFGVLGSTESIESETLNFKP